MESKKVLEATYTKCDGCGSGLIFEPDSQELICEHCKTKKNFEKNTIYEKHNLKEKPTSFEGYSKWKTENKVLRCETCGAEVILNNLEYSGNCSYCGSSYVSEVDKLPGLVPDAIIPFKFDEEGALQRFYAGVRKKFFVPRAFKKKINTDKIRGIYIPTFSFDANTVTSYSGRLSRTRNTSNGSENYNFNIAGKKNLTINDEMVETSSQITQQELRKILPYNMQGAFKFDENFIRGYVVEHFESAFDECYKQAKEAMLRRIKQEILSGYNYDTVIYLNIDPMFSDEKYAYRLVPIYQFEYKYKNKPYKSQMNGQTGKIGGKLPTSGWKVFLVVLMVLAFLAGVTLLTLLTG